MMRDSNRIVLGISLEPAESLMIRMSGEFVPGSWVKGASTPLPSTITGALAYAGWSMNRACSSGLGRWDAMRECLVSLLHAHGLINQGTRGRDVVIRGPVVSSGSKLYVGCSEGFVEVSPEGISEWVRRQESGEVPGKRAGRVLHELIRLRSVLEERTGVGLERGRKVVKLIDESRGLLYTAPYVYYYIGRYGIDEGGRGRLQGIEYLALAVDIVINAASQATLPSPRNKAIIPVRLGGEDRKALIRVDTEAKILAALEKMWKKQGDAGEALLVLATPLIMRGIKSGELSNEPITPKLVRDMIIREVKESIRGVAEIKVDEVFSIHSRVRPRVAPLQLGYDERNGSKGHIRPALMPGAVFKAKVVGDWREIYFTGAGDFSGVGFGTLLPIPYSVNPV